MKKTVMLKVKGKKPAKTTIYSRQLAKRFCGVAMVGGITTAGDEWDLNGFTKVSKLEADTEALADCAALPLSVTDRETEALRV